MGIFYQNFRNSSTVYNIEYIMVDSRFNWGKK